MNILFSFIITLITLSCSSVDCNKLPGTFKNYSDAIRQVEAASYPMKDKANTSGSSWIRSAKYYSCDGNLGFMIYTTASKKYIHAGVPLDVWKGFKGASSKGIYYSKNVKGRYALLLK